jgi:hypothetical protein
MRTFTKPSALLALLLTIAALAPPAMAQQDMRMPDRRDAAESYHPVMPSEPSQGFDWLSAALGAAAGTGLTIVAVALETGSRRRRHRVVGARS